MVAAEIVVTATMPHVVETIVDENDAPKNLTGATQPPRLQGVSQEIANELDVVGVVTDAANGQVTFASIGAVLTVANLTDAGVDSALFLCRVKYWDAAGKFDYGEAFSLKFVLSPLDEV